MESIYGNILQDKLLKIVDSSKFKKLWGLKKDKIHVCMDCEYRYACTDCRAFIEDPEDILSKPLKCGYNPYTGKWGNTNKGISDNLTIRGYE